MNTKPKFMRGLGLAVAMLCGVRFAAAQPQNQQALGFFSLGLKEKEPQKKIAAYTNAVVAEHFLTEGRTDSDAIAVLESALEVERRRLRA